MDIVQTLVSDELQRIQRRLVELTALLKDFRHDYSRVSTNEVLRFELLCERMFGSFIFQRGTIDEPLCPFSNLDTGDALPRPYPPFVAALQDEATKVGNDAHHYYQPGSIESLAKATFLFLEREGFCARRDPLSDLAILPGAGTTQIYDSLCKVHVETPGDTILVPELGYGFFLTQPARVGGRTGTAGCDDRGVVSGASLHAAIEGHNWQLWREWRLDSETLFNRGVRQIVQAGYLNNDRDFQNRAYRFRELLEETPGGWCSPEGFEILTHAAPELSDHALRTRVINTLRPPRVVAFLHIQPSVSGHVYTESEVDTLANVLHESGVVAFEDLAYHSIRCRLRNLPSLLGSSAIVYTMFGISKPMAIANLRLGLLLVDEANSIRINRSIESSASFVSTLLQRSLATALLAEGFDKYISEHSSGADGYDTRERLMHRLLIGGHSESDDSTLSLLRSAVARQPELEPFVQDFRRQGLSRWLRPFTIPEAGFFYIVSCEPLLRNEIFRRLHIRSSFDVFALLAYLFDLRTIPEECMRPGSAPGTRLRMAFSPDPEEVARLFLHAFAGLSLIERGVASF